MLYLRTVPAPRFVVLALVALTSACSVTFRDARVPAGEEKSEWAHHYLLGAVGEAEVDVRDHCSTGRAREIWVGEDVLTLGVSIVTLGIYTPRKVAIVCAREEAKKP
ncbi:MAG: hypothetical protein U0263_33780 [Polyangiaceae bacterium]